MTANNDIAFKSAGELSQSLRNSEISSLELTNLYIDRIERFDEEINAVVVRDFDRARDAARRADEKRSAGKAEGVLHGVPMTIKDSFDVAGLPTTWGFPDFKDNIAGSDSLAVERFKQAGAIFLGKTNIPVALADLQSYNPIYGQTGNPWDLERTPGGSSGGASAALSAGLTGLETGSDIGGSIRNPAHFCGVYGHKPTWGVVPPQGHALPGAIASPDIAVCGPLARSAEDLALALGVLAGPEPLDAAGWRLDLPKPSRKSLAEYRVAIWPTDAMCPVDDEVAGRARELGEMLSKCGATVSETARPDIDLAAGHRTYLELLNGVMGASLKDDQRIGLEAVAEASDLNDLSNEAVSMRAMVSSHAQWLSANNRREKLRYAWQQFFADWDIVICPQTATPAFPHDHRPFPARTLDVNGVEQGYMDQLFWSGLITAPYLPSTVFPTGPSAAGLPIGLQAVGAAFQDYVTIDFTRLVAEQIGGFVAPPNYA